MKGWIVIYKIKLLYDNGNGLTERKIAKELGLSRNTVSRERRWTVKGRLSLTRLFLFIWEVLGKASKFEDYKLNNRTWN